MSLKAKIVIAVAVILAAFFLFPRFFKVDGTMGVLIGQPVGKSITPVSAGQVLPSPVPTVGPSSQGVS